MQSLCLKILILGGTTFLGPQLVQEFQSNGHEVSLFTRGKQSSSFENVEKLEGNRDGKLDALKGRQWDAIIDTSGHLPRLVQDSSKILANSTKHYTFISTIGVYKDFHLLNIDENYPVAALRDEKIEEITESTEGALKAACEKVVQNYFPNKSLIIRPGLIVGPGDPTGRFSYWPLRLLEGGEILAPGNPSQSIQFIDVRDLAKWIVAMVERKATGIYNATGPAEVLTFEQLLKECQKWCKTPSSFTWVNEEFLIKNEVKDWVELPLWLSSKRDMPGFLSINANKSEQAGLTFRPLVETIDAILKEEVTKKGMGLDKRKESHLLNQWKQTLSVHSR